MTEPTRMTNLAVVALRTALRGVAGDPRATREEADKVRLSTAFERGQYPAPKPVAVPEETNEDR